MPLMACRGRGDVPGCSASPRLMTCRVISVAPRPDKSGYKIKRVHEDGCTHPDVGQKWVLCRGLARRGVVQLEDVLGSLKKMMLVLFRRPWACRPCRPCVRIFF